MSFSKISRVAGTILLSLFAVSALSFGHVATASGSATGRSMDMGHATSTTQCQSVCTMAIAAERGDDRILVRQDEREPVLRSRFVVTISLALLAVPFIVKILYRLSSWEPPDLVLIHGHFADGL